MPAMKTRGALTITLPDASRLSRRVRSIVRRLGPEFGTGGRTRDVISNLVRRMAMGFLPAIDSDGEWETHEIPLVEVGHLDTLFVVSLAVVAGDAPCAKVRKQSRIKPWTWYSAAAQLLAARAQEALDDGEVAELRRTFEGRLIGFCGRYRFA